MIEVTGCLLPEDYVRAQYLHIRPRFAFKVFGVLIFLAVLWAMWYSLFGDDNESFVLADLILPAGILYVGLFFFVYIPWKTRRTYKQQKSLQREAKMTFDESGFSAANEFGSGITPWSDYVRWKENDHLFLLYISDPLYHMVPKRMFSKTDDVDQLRQILLTNIGRSAA